MASAFLCYHPCRNVSLNLHIWKVKLMPVNLAPNGLPTTSKWLFPEYEFGKMNPDDYAGVVMERILEKGNWAEVKWLFNHYGKARLAGWVRRHGFRLLSPRSFALWRLALDVKKYRAPAWARKAKEMGW
jgi:hypothetical protein